MRLPNMSLFDLAPGAEFAAALARRAVAAVGKSTALVFASLTIVATSAPGVASGQVSAGDILFADLNNAAHETFLVSRRKAPNYTAEGSNAFSVRSGDQNYYFFSNEAGGGLQTPTANYLGPQLFTGTVDDPVFDEGVFTLTGGTRFRLTALTDLVFTLDGPHTAKFVLPFTPTYSTNQQDYTIAPFSGIFDGVATDFAGLTFYAGGDRLVLTRADGVELLDLISNLSIFSGHYLLPMETLLTDTATHSQSYGLSIAPIQWSSGPAPVPEPAAWVLMILGAALAGQSLRRTRRRCEPSLHGS